jgi:hypothetical protein
MIGRNSIEGVFSMEQTRFSVRAAGLFTALAFVGALAVAGCQGIVAPNGQLSGITVPPGCKAEGTISFPVATGALSFACDETSLSAPAALANSRKLQLLAPGQ